MRRSTVLQPLNERDERRNPGAHGFLFVRTVRVEKVSPYRHRAAAVRGSLCAAVDVRGHLVGGEGHPDGAGGHLCHALAAHALRSLRRNVLSFVGIKPAPVRSLAKLMCLLSKQRLERLQGNEHDDSRRRRDRKVVYVQRPEAE
jgi:hypothetical protein